MAEPAVDIAQFKSEAPTILCVDDERMILSSLRQQLRDHFDSATIETAESGEEGLEVFQELCNAGMPVPVVVSDQLMPGMRGEAFLEAVHKLQPATLTVLLTGQATADAVGMAVNRANLYRYIGKPWTETDLVMTVREALRAWAQARDLKRKERELTEAHAASLRFVPGEFLRLLKRKQLTEVLVGDHTTGQMHILIADIRGYTKRIEHKDPAEAFRELNEYTGILEEAIRAHGGFINSLEGDGILALFPGKAEDAVKAGIDAHHALRQYGRSSGAADPIRMGLAVHSGRLLLGTVGNSERLKCDVVGDAVNLCARIESLTRRLDTEMLITGDNADQIADRPNLRKLGVVRVRGREDPVTVYEVLDALPPDRRRQREATLATFSTAMSDLEAGDLTAAVTGFEAVLAEDPGDKAAQLQLAHCRAVAADPAHEGRSMPLVLE